MSTIQIVVPEDVFSAIEAEAKSQEVSIDAVASILLCHLVAELVLHFRGSFGRSVSSLRFADRPF